LKGLGISRRHVPVPDRGAPTVDQLLEVRAWFVAREDAGQIYVHCGGGFGRAATMAVGMLVLDGQSVDEAVHEVQRVRPEIRINEAQSSWLRTVEQQRPSISITPASGGNHPGTPPSQRS